MRRRYAQARRARRFEFERPTAGAIVREGAAWAAINYQRLPGLLLTVGCLVLLVYFFVDTRFFVYEAQVTGNQLLPAAGIYQASGADMQSIFFLTPRAVQQRLLASFPGLEEVRVALGLPARLQIRVTERQAQFVWEAGGQAYLADDRGNILGAGVRPQEAVLIRCMEEGAAAAGLPLDPAVLDTAAHLSKLLGGARTFEYSTRYGIAWRGEQGWPVYFGVGGDLPQKVAVMRSLAAELAGKGITPQFLDVGVPSRPYYR